MVYIGYLHVCLCGHGGAGVPMAADVGEVVSVKEPGVVAGIFPAVTSPASGRHGRRRSASVIPCVIFVRPITGGSPLLANSHNPGDIALCQPRMLGNCSVQDKDIP